ncbi:hypothetical protein PIGHUM_04735 [Pigmentiphaga humi]|uniref:Uncharacterized protein n=1 Tax=Pigmentiphaga humi TaxID=2478468 RepID=A0A3P4B8R7_9BURK|nr:hypothetical protein PIGHUM_04735 [Pigmentiphaga humi]
MQRPDASVGRHAGGGDHDRRPGFGGHRGPIHRGRRRRGRLRHGAVGQFRGIRGLRLRRFGRRRGNGRQRVRQHQWRADHDAGGLFPRRAGPIHRRRRGQRRQHHGLEPGLRGFVGRCGRRRIGRLGNGRPGRGGGESRRHDHDLWRRFAGHRRAIHRRGRGQRRLGGHVCGVGHVFSGDLGGWYGSVRRHGRQRRHRQCQRPGRPGLRQRRHHHPWLRRQRHPGAVDRRRGRPWRLHRGGVRRARGCRRGGHRRFRRVGQQCFVRRRDQLREIDDHGRRGRGLAGAVDRRRRRLGRLRLCRQHRPDRSHQHRRRRVGRHGRQRRLRAREQRGRYRRGCRGDRQRAGHPGAIPGRRRWFGRLRCRRRRRLLWRRQRGGGRGRRQRRLGGHGHGQQLVQPGRGRRYVAGRGRAKRGGQRRSRRLCAGWRAGGRRQPGGGDRRGRGQGRLGFRGHAEHAGWRSAGRHLRQPVGRAARPVDRRRWRYRRLEPGRFGQPARISQRQPRWSGRQGRQGGHGQCIYRAEPLDRRPDVRGHPGAIDRRQRRRGRLCRRRGGQ